MLEWLKAVWAKYKVHVTVVGGALVVATVYGQCTLEPNVDAIEQAVEDAAEDAAANTAGDVPTTIPATHSNDVDGEITVNAEVANTEDAHNTEATDDNIEITENQ